MNNVGSPFFSWPFQGQVPVQQPAAKKPTGTNKYPVKSDPSITAQDRENNRIFHLYQNLNTVLRRNGYPAELIGIVLAQVMHETNYMKSRLASAFNLTGIKYYPGYANHVKYGKTGVYVKFPTLDAWAQDLRDHYLSQNKTGAGRPWDATDYVEYSKRLKANGFYTASLDEYTKGLQRAILKNNAAVRWYYDQQKKGNPVQAAITKEMEVQKPAGGPMREMIDQIEARNEAKNNELAKWWNNMSTTNKIIAGVVGAIILNKILD